MKAVLYGLLLVTLILSACAPRATNLSRISLDMSKNEVRRQIGEPHVVRGSIRNKYSEVIDVWEYHFYRYAGAIEGVSPYYDPYWLYFVNDTLVQWGQAGDWSKEADRIYEVRFR
jgi:hypothetical protein